MLRLPGSLRGAAVVCFAIGGVLSMSSPVMADSSSSSASGGSVTVTAVIAPVRQIIVNGQGIIIEVVSNTSQDITPNVYKKRPDAAPATLTPAIYGQYTSLIRHINTRRTGVIYKLEDSVPDKFVARYPAWLVSVSKIQNNHHGQLKNWKNRLVGAAPPVDTVKL